MHTGEATEKTVSKVIGELKQDKVDLRIIRPHRLSYAKALPMSEPSRISE